MPITVNKRAPWPYDAVVQGLKDQRAKIDAAITALEALRDVGVPQPAAMTEAKPEQGSLPIDEAAEASTIFRGMPIPEAAIKLLRIRNKQLGNPDITRELLNGGLIMKSVKPVNTIGAVLTRRANDVGDIVKVGRGVWALREWVRKPKNGQDSNGGTGSGDEAQESAAG